MNAAVSAALASLDPSDTRRSPTMRGPQTEAIRRSLHLSIDPTPYREATSSTSDSSPSPILSTRASVATTNTTYSVVPADDECRICSVFCLFDYWSDDADHLSFRKGDFLDIVKQEETGWWAAMRPGGNRVGWIPCGYVQTLADDTAKTIARVDSAILMWSPEEKQSRPGTIRRNSELPAADVSGRNEWDSGDADEEHDNAHHKEPPNHYTPDGHRPTASWNPISRAGLEQHVEYASPEDGLRGLPSPHFQAQSSRTNPLSIISHRDKPTPPTPVSPPAAVDYLRGRLGETATAFSPSSAFSPSTNIRRPIFITPGAGPVPNRVEVPVQQASRLPPVDESSSGVSTETDNDVVLVDRVTRVDKVRQLTGDENAQRFVDAKVALATAPWYNRPLYAAEELKTDFDGTVKMGTLRALIEYLTGDFINAQQERTFRNVFFLTFRTFATSDEIFNLLSARYEMLPPDGISSAEADDWRIRKLLPIQNRVLMCFTTWLEDHDMLNEDPHISRRMQEFMSQITQPASLALAARLILGSLERLTFAYPQSATSISSPATKKRKIKALKGDPLVRMDPGIIAQHLVTLEHRLFLKVKAQECLNWAKVQNGRTVANLQAFTMTHERIANWVKSSVLNENGLGKRADTVDFWIKVAEKCRALNNFASMSAIVAGLASTVIARLHLTWAHVGRVNHLDTLTKLAEPANNFSTWRTLLASTEGPCIPFIGMYLSDIVHVNDQLPDTIPGPGGLAFICFQKRMKWAEAVNSIVRHQGKPYFLAEDPSTMTFIEQQLSNAASKDGNVFWNRSVELQQAELAHADIRKGLEQAGF